MKKTKQELTEKDREILKEVDRIIWNPELLNKFKGSKEQEGCEKRKKTEKKV
ncbi:MAG: hypothetical protein QW286_03330 [Candidatus Aenigmatarchaeota archaeon]